jgi:hypothetical protein
MKLRPRQGGQRGGIWQGAAGLAAGLDSGTGSTYIYTSTGDGDFDLNVSGGLNAADSFLKLSPALPQSPSGYFTPSDQKYRQCKDKDYGSAGTMLLPDGTHPNYPYLALKAEKENYLWAMDRHSPGGYNVGSCDSYCSVCDSSCQLCPSSAWANQNIQALVASSNGNEARSTPAFWNGNSSGFVKGWVFFAVAHDFMKAYAVATSCTPANGGGNGPVLCEQAFASTQVMGYAATPSISSGPAPNYQNGIVWGINRETVGSGLFAFDATNLSKLWDSGQCVDPSGNPRDQIGFPTTFSVPTVANGHVYVGTETDFDIFGQVATRTCTPGT